jgi:P4 family phage/plasmid primase-like protien
MEEVTPAAGDLSPARFVKELWGIAPPDWFVEFFLIQYRPTLEDPDKKAVSCVFYTVEQVLKDWPTIASSLERLNRTEVRNIHPCVNPRARRPKKRGKNSDVDAYVAAWGDIDFHQNEVAVRAAFWKAVEIFTAAGLRPSIILESGHGLHAYWLFDKPYSSKEARPCCAGLQDAFKIADAISDPARVLRMPGTINLKDPLHPAECRIIEASWKRYPLSAFKDYAISPGKSAEDLEDEKGRKILESLGKSNNAEIEEIKKGVTEGGRDNAAAKYAGWLFAKGVPANQVEQTLLEWNKLNTPPLPDEELLKTAASIQRSEKESHPEGRKKKRHRGKIEHYFNGKEFLPEVLSREICSGSSFIATPIDKSGTGSTIYIYRDGCFRPDGAHAARMDSHRMLDIEAKPGRIDNVIDLIRIAKSIDYSALNKRAKDLVNVVNGMLDWRSGKLLPHGPEHLSTFQINAKWDPGAKPEALDKFLSEIASPQDVLFIEELMGYLMIPDTSFHKSFAFVGMPGTGKSTLLKLISTWLGEANVSAIPLQSIESNQFATSGLFGKLANICTELKNDALEDVGMVKAISSGETITAEEKYQSRFSFEPFCRLVFSANEFPQVSDRKGAFVTRMIFVEFENIFRGTRGEVKGYHQLLAQNPETLPAMLNKAVIGLRRLMENGKFTQSDASRRLASDYTRRCNSVLFFIEENCKTNVEGAWLARREFYQRYNQWAKDHGLKPVSVHSCLEVIRAIRPAVSETFRDGYPGLKWVNWVGGNPPVTTRSEVSDFGANRDSSLF